MKAVWTDTTDPKTGIRTIKFGRVVATNPGKHGAADWLVMFQVKDGSAMQVAPTVAEMFVALSLMAKGQGDTFGRSTNDNLSIGPWVQEGVALTSINEIRRTGELIDLVWENNSLTNELGRYARR